MDSETGFMPSIETTAIQHREQHELSLRPKYEVHADLRRAEMTAEAVWAKASTKFEGLDDNQYERLRQVMLLIDDETIDDTTYSERKQKQAEDFHDDPLEDVVATCLTIADARRVSSTQSPRQSFLSLL